MTFRPMLPASVVLAATAAIAQTTAQPKAQAAAPAPATSSYAIPIGTSVNLDTAKKAAAAASAEAHKNNWFMAIAVVDPAGMLVYYEKADTTQLASAQVAIDKGESVVVGVNRFADGENAGLPTLTIDAEVERRQIERVRAVRAGRSESASRAALEQVRTAARDNTNLVPPIVAAVEASATLGEIASAMRDVFGEYTETTTV